RTPLFRRSTMTRTVVASLLFGAMMIAVAKAQTVTPPPAPAKNKAADSLDALIGAALANDADVKLARAKVQLAEAELARARQTVTHRVVALDSSVREQKKAIATAETGLQLVTAAYQKGSAPLGDVLPYREKLETAQAKLASLETELKLL